MAVPFIVGGNVEKPSNPFRILARWVWKILFRGMGISFSGEIEDATASNITYLQYPKARKCVSQERPCTISKRRIWISGKADQPERRRGRASSKQFAGALKEIFCKRIGIRGPIT